MQTTRSTLAALWRFIEGHAEDHPNYLDVNAPELIAARKILLNPAPLPAPTVDADGNLIGYVATTLAAVLDNDPGSLTYAFARDLGVQAITEVKMCAVDFQAPDRIIVRVEGKV